MLIDNERIHTKPTLSKALCLGFPQVLVSAGPVKVLAPDPYAGVVERILDAGSLRISFARARTIGGSANPSSGYRSCDIPPFRPPKVTPYVLVNCRKRGISLRTMQDLLGHDRISATETCMNLSLEDAIPVFQSKW